MSMTIHDERQLTGLDVARLRRMAAAGAASQLAELLDEARVVDPRDVAADVVTMNARVEVEDLHTRRRQSLVVCYPRDAQPGAGLVSVLSPVGLALLGLQAGAVARWQTPDGEEHAAAVMAVPFQPEAAGDYLT